MFAKFELQINVCQVKRILNNAVAALNAKIRSGIKES